MVAPQNAARASAAACATVVAAHEDVVRVDAEAAAAFAAGVDAERVTELAAPLRMPVRFDSLEEEVGFHVLYHALDFGSGLDPVLRAKAGKTTHEAVQYGLLGAVIAGHTLDGTWLRSFTPYTFQQLFGVDSHEDAPMEGTLQGIVTMSRPGQLAPWCTAISDTLRGIGELCGEGDHTGPGAALLATAAEVAAGASDRPSATALVARLVDEWPCFHDKALVDGTAVEFMRKAQNLVYALYRRYGDEDPRFNFADVADLTGDTSAATVAVLSDIGVLRPNEELAAAIRAGTPITAGTQERCLRAAAVAGLQACANACIAAGKPLTAADLGSYMNAAVATEEELKGAARHLTPDTTAY